MEAAEAMTEVEDVSRGSWERTPDPDPDPTAGRILCSAAWIRSWI